MCKYCLKNKNKKQNAHWPEKPHSGKHEHADTFLRINGSTIHCCTPSPSCSSNKIQKTKQKKNRTNQQTVPAPSLAPLLSLHKILPTKKMTKNSQHLTSYQLQPEVSPVERRQGISLGLVLLLIHSRWIPPTTGNGRWRFHPTANLWESMDLSTLLGQRRCHLATRKTWLFQHNLPKRSQTNKKRALISVQAAGMSKQPVPIFTTKYRTDLKICQGRALSTVGLLYWIYMGQPCWPTAEVRGLWIEH